MQETALIELFKLRQAVRDSRKDAGDKKEENENESDGNRSNSLVDLPHLFQVLASQRNKGATDPRDKVYAFLGISSQPGDCEIQPDYDMDINKLYIAVAKQLIQETSHQMDVLSACQPSYSTRNLPSWVPDWSQPWRGGIGMRGSFMAGAKLKSFVHVDTKNDTILIRGLRLDVVRSIRGTPFNNWKPNPWFPVPLYDALTAESARLGYNGYYPFTGGDLQARSPASSDRGSRSDCELQTSAKHPYMSNLRLQATPKSILTAHIQEGGTCYMKTLLGLMESGTLSRLRRDISD